jgi:hypothetical protein
LYASPEHANNPIKTIKFFSKFHLSEFLSESGPITCRNL